MASKPTHYSVPTEDSGKKKRKVVKSETSLCDQTFSLSKYVQQYTSTLQWVGLLAIYQYMLVHCSGWAYWLYTSICWYTVVYGFTGYIPVYYWYIASKPTHYRLPTYTGI
jgi:hypothetical protein